MIKVESQKELARTLYTMDDDYEIPLKNKILKEKMNTLPSARRSSEFTNVFDEFNRTLMNHSHEITN